MKQYLMMCDENGMNNVKALLRGDVVQFLEVQGLTTTGEYNVLVTPVVQPLPQAVVSVEETPSTEMA
jgi:hypothetical protein